MDYRYFFDKFANKNKIIFSIGDKGIILTIFKKNRLVARAFAKSTAEEEIQAVNELMHREPKLPITIIIDFAEQNFSRQTLPAVSSFNVNNILRKKLARSFPEDNLKAYKLLGKSDETNNEWQYLFISANLTDNSKAWLDFILNYPNKIKTIHSTVIELANLKENLLKISDKIPENAGSNNWELLICHNKISGFRQVAFKNNKIIFTRLIPSSEDDSIDFLAGNIEQETTNSLEYLQRLSYKKDDPLVILVIVSHEIKAKLKNSRFKTSNISFFTPYEISGCLKLPDAALNEDKFADVIIAASLAKYGHILPLENELTNKLNLYRKITMIGNTPTVILLPIFIIYLLFTCIEVFTIQHTVSLLLDEKVAVINELDKYQRIADNQKDKLKMLKLVNLYKNLIGNYQTPFNFFEKIKASISSFITIEFIDWKYYDKFENKKANQNDIVAIFKVNIQNQNATYNQLFDEVDRFIRDVSSSFSEYNIDYNRTNEKLNFNENVKTIPLQLTISGPKKSIKIGRNNEN